MSPSRSQAPNGTNTSVSKTSDSDFMLESPSKIESIVIANRQLPVCQEVLDTLFLWMAERDRIRRKRLAGQPQPWSDDPIFIHNKFCHVFRTYDRGTQYILREVINKGSQDHRETCFRIILFKFFNRISTWELLQKHLGPLSWKTFNLEAYERVLGDALETSPIYTSAYQIPAPDLVSGPGFKSHLVVLEMMMQEDLPGQLLSREHIRDAFELIQLYPGMGPFLSYQLLLDLNMTSHFNFSEKEWAACGPGSRDCLERIFGEGVRGIESDAIGYLHKSQAAHFARLNITDPPRLHLDLPEGVSFVDLEHSLCECSKYIRAKQHSRNAKWTASEEPTTSDLPVKCLQAISAPAVVTVEGSSFLPPANESVDDDVYEVSHIVSERASQGPGGRKYRIRWVGYGPDEDTWHSETDLQDASALLVEWRERCAAQDGVNRRVDDHRRTKRPAEPGSPPMKRKLRRRV